MTDVGQDRRPEVGSVVKRNRCRNDPGIGHLQQVFFGQVGIGFLDEDLRLAGLLELLALLSKQVVCETDPVDIDFFAAQVFDTGNLRRVLFETTTSFKPEIIGIEKSTRFSRSGVTVTTEAMISP